MPALPHSEVQAPMAHGSVLARRSRRADRVPTDPQTDVRARRESEVLAAFALLDAPADTELDAVARIAAALTGAPYAQINILDAARQCSLAAHGAPAGERSRKDSICARTYTDPAVFWSPDLAADPRFHDHPAVDGRRGRARFYASASLRLDGVAIGTICVYDTTPCTGPAADGPDRLADLATVVVGLLERRRCARLAVELAASAEAARAELAVVHEELGAARAFDTALLDALPVGVVAADADGRISVRNETVRRWNGPDHDPGPTSEDAADGRTPLAVEEGLLTRLFQKGRLHDVEVTMAAAGRPARIVSCSGQQVRDTSGRRLGAVITMADVTGQRELENRLRAAALHDPLTGLPNRSLLVDRLELALATRARSGGPLAVLYCDLDRFKAVNDNWGHTAGDVVLIETAARLVAAVRPGDTVARIGGDEFVVLCPGLDVTGTADAVRARVTAALAEPLRSGPGQLHTVGISIGLAFAGAGSTAETLLTAADEAMYQVNGVRRGRA
ncbi:diguanylate cyclase (GGDEF) domain-containing protein [Modestobacter sp. DSM 44400]|uniref:sensor domain-containing diguanylate cyclase n=1 Tax=Modestobacter sp. DSM 44400 TaxID=1550230 RepID=UPI0008956D37|nr:sensor domain-containing diguanylate cyclase [Modestobacter sp. DSM 44400]SDY57996.1 diguanylate cyclase (GGDEF) domain-containing protein [Modestobacter sp. DSM 44400]